jgi:hybrid cluster-associated redox disulfide protein
MEVALKAGNRIYPNMPIDVVMRLWPATITVLIGHNMHCVGCALAPFHSVSDAAFEHKIDETAFLSDLERAVAADVT